VFEQSCPKMVLVFIGNQDTLRKKVINLWETKLPDENFEILYENIIRYILSKILYGNFDINYLLRQYYKQFLTDLQKSKKLFENPTYSSLYKYFKHD